MAMKHIKKVLNFIFHQENAHESHKCDTILTLLKGSSENDRAYIECGQDME